MIEIITDNIIFERQVRLLLSSPKLKDIIKNELIRKNNTVTAVNDTAVIYITDKNISVDDESVVFYISDKKSLKKNIHYYSFKNFDENKFLNDLFFILSQKNRIKNKLNSVRSKDNYISRLESYLSDLQSTTGEAHNEQIRIMTKIPENVSDIFDIFSFYQPYSEVSGDFIFQKEINGKLFIMIGDVTGHGISRGCYAASLYSMAEAYFSICSSFDINLNSFVKFMWINANTYKGNKRNTQISATTLFVEIGKGYVKFINCGHCRPVFLSSGLPVKSNDKKPVPYAEMIDMDIYMPLGDIINPEKNTPDFNIKKIKLNEEDGLFLYTDGITELFLDENEKSTDSIYSGERLLRVIQSNLEYGWTSKEVITRIIQDVDTYSSGGILENLIQDSRILTSNDDIAMCCLKRK